MDGVFVANVRLKDVVWGGRRGSSGTEVVAAPLLGTGVAASGHDERDVPRSDVGNEEHEY